MKHIWAFVKGITTHFCYKMVLTFLLRPHLLFSTLMATVEATRYAEQLFPNESSYSHGIANAYKHAVWNALLAFRTLWFFRSVKKSLQWAKKVTDMHEDCFLNVIEDRKMDLNNNAKGRLLLTEMIHEKIPLNKENIAAYVYQHKNRLETL